MSDKSKQKAYELSSLTELLNLFDQRDMTYAAFSDEIARLIKPTVFAALDDLFGVEQGYSQVSWLDISVGVETRVLFLVGMISYHPDTENLPPVIQKLAPVDVPIDENEVIARLQRVLKIGVPLEMVFKSPAEIVEFLSVSVEAMEQMTGEVPVVKVDAETGETLPMKKEPEDSEVIINKNEFDASALTKEQISQLLIFQHAGKGTKH